MCAQQENHTLSTEEQGSSRSSLSLETRLPKLFGVDGPKENYPSCRFVLHQSSGGTLYHNFTGHFVYSTNPLIQNQMLQDILRREEKSQAVIGLQESRNGQKTWTYTPEINLGERNELTVEIPNKIKYGKKNFSFQKQSISYFTLESIQSPNSVLQQTSKEQWSSVCNWLNPPSFKFTIESQERFKELEFIIVLTTLNGRGRQLGIQKIQYKTWFIDKANLNGPLADTRTSDQNTLQKHWKELLDYMQSVDLVVEKLFRLNVLDRNESQKISEQTVQKEKVGELLCILFEKKEFLAEFIRALESTRGNVRLTQLLNP